MSDNSQQIEYWNGKAGATWVAAQARLDTFNIMPSGDVNKSFATVGAHYEISEFPEDPS